MRIRKIYIVLWMWPLLVSVLSTSCSKTGYTVTSTTADSATQIIIAGDEMNVNYEVDQAVNEALLATSLSCIASGNTASIGTGPVLYNTISQTIIDTGHIADSALIHLTYYGKNADGTKGRTGIVTVHLSRDGNGRIIPWTAAGATMSITFQQYEVILLSNNKSIWMNGTALLTNVTGGLLKQPSDIALAPGDSLKDKVSAAITFTYNDNTTNIITWTWNINQSRLFTMANSILTAGIRGDTAMNNITGISTSGATRFNTAFYTQVTAPVVQSISSAYLLSNPVSGEKTIHGIPEPITIDYGVNSNGMVVQSNAYGYKMTWAQSGKQQVAVEAY